MSFTFDRTPRIKLFYAARSWDATSCTWTRLAMLCKSEQEAVTLAQLRYRSKTNAGARVQAYRVTGRGAKDNTETVLWDSLEQSQ